MKKRKVFSLLDLLSPKEQHKFGRWLRGEVNVNKSLLLHLFDLMTKERNEKPIWDALFPKLPFKAAKLRKLFNQLSVLLEDFIAIESFRQDKQLRNLQLIQELNHRNANDIFMQTHNQAQKVWINEGVKDHLYYWAQYKLAFERREFEAKMGIKPATDAIQEILHYLDAWIIHEKKFMDVIHAYTSKKYKNHTHIIQIDDLTKKNQVSMPSSIVLEIYEKLYNLFQHHPYDCSSLIQDLRHYKKLFSLHIFQNLYTLLFNYLVQRYNKENSEELGVQILTVYEWGIEDQLIFVDGLLYPQHYKNLVIIALKLKLPEKARYYLNTYQKYLSEHERDDLYALCHAFCLFEEGDFKAVVKVLQRIYFDHIIYEISRRKYLLRALYELGERVELETPLHSLYEFIRTQKQLPKLHQESNFEEIKFFLRLVRASKKQTLKQLLAELEVVSLPSDKVWLIDKVNQSAIIQ